MNFLKPNKIKINVAALIFIAIYGAVLFDDIIMVRRNIKIESYIMNLGGEIANNGTELNRLYSQVQKDTKCLPNNEQQIIRDINFKYGAIRWSGVAVFSYLLSCLIVFRVKGENKSKI